MASIDELYIDITANAVKANDSIDRLSQKLGRLSTSLSSLNSSNLTGLANGVSKLSTAMQGMKNVGTADFTRLTKNLNNIGTVNTASLNRLASATTQISKSFSNFTGASQGIKTIGELATGIKQLGYASSTKAIENIPKLSVAMRQLMSELSQAPKVSQNLISMTNALANFSRSMGSTNTTTNATARSLRLIPSATSRANRGFTSLAATIGKVYATYWLLFRAFGKISQAMNLASNLTEVENVINHTFGSLRTRIDDFTKDSIEKFGLAELAAKQYAGRFQAMGKAMGISNNAVAQSTEFLNEKLGKSASIYGNLGNSMADLSVNLTKLTSDYASFFDVAQSNVAEDFQSIFTGTTKPLRQYGIDLTTVNLKQFALNNGLNSNIATMTQAEKAMLRYQYVMANSSHIMGDFARTSDTWHNTIVRLKNNFQTLGVTVGKAFINLLKPVAVFVNNAIVGLNKVAVAISNALGKLLGWKYEAGSGGMTTDYEDAAEAADDMAGGTGKAAKAAKELKRQLQGIDELNVLHTNDDNGGGGGSGGGSAAGGGGGTTGQDGSWVKTSGMFDWDGNTWRDLGRQIGDGLKTAMDNIPWDSIYKKASKFGEGLAEFLNGLFEGEKGNTLFGKVGQTIAGALNTSLEFLYGFAKTFDWEQFGRNFADGLNQYFKNFNFELLAKTLNEWVDGIKSSIVTFIKEVSWTDVLKGAFDFANGLELDTIAVLIGGFTWFHGGKEIVAGTLKSTLSTQIATGIGDGTIKLSTAIGVTLLTAKIGFEIGEWIYNNTSFSKFSDAVAEWMVDENGDIKIGRAITVTLGGLAISLGGLALAKWIFNGVTSSTTAMAANTMFKAIEADLSTAMSSLGAVGLKVGLAIGVAIASWKIGNTLYEKVPTVQQWADSLAELILGGYTPAEISKAITGIQIDAGFSIAGKILGVELPESEKEKISNKMSELMGGAKALSGNPLFAVDMVVENMKFGKNVGTTIGGMIAEFVDWKKDPQKFKNDVTGMIASFINWTKESTFLRNVTGMIASFANWLLESTFGKTITGFIAKIFKWEKDEKGGFSNTIGNMIASIVKADKDKKFDDKKNTLEMDATVKKATKAKGFKGGILSGMTAKITKFTDALGKKNKTIEFKAVISSSGIPSSAIAAMKRAGWTVQAEGGVYKNGKWNSIPQYATGGFPNHGSMFIAGEAGAEVVGHVNGRTEVLNQSQMASTMYSAVVSANSEQNALLRQQNELLMGILEKNTGISYKDVFKATQKGAREYTQMTGKYAF